MLEPFLGAYPPTEITVSFAGAPRNPWPGGPVAGFTELTTAYLHYAFREGIYRLHSQASGEKADRLIRERCPWVGETVYSFGYDWLGRQFALDGRRMSANQPLVLMCDLVTGEAFKIPATFLEFHNSTLIDDGDAALDTELFAQWSAANPGILPLKPDKVVGYRIPLSLGGDHDVENLEVVDFEVEMELSGQITAQIETVSEGTRITGIASDDA